MRYESDGQGSRMTPCEYVGPNSGPCGAPRASHNTDHLTGEYVGGGIDDHEYVAHYHDTDSAETGWCSGCGRTDLAVRYQPDATGHITFREAERLREVPLEEWPVEAIAFLNRALARPRRWATASRRDDEGFHPQEECRACGYVLELHTTPRSDLGGWPDRSGGCPESEVAAMMRWGVL